MGRESAERGACLDVHGPRPIEVLGPASALRALAAPGSVRRNARRPSSACAMGHAILNVAIYRDAIAWSDAGLTSVCP